MSSSPALVNEAGITRRIPAGDTLLVGSAIDASILGALQIGAANASEVLIQDNVGAFGRWDADVYVQDSAGDYVFLTGGTCQLADVGGDYLSLSAGVNLVANGSGPPFNFNVSIIDSAGESLTMNPTGSGALVLLDQKGDSLTLSNGIVLADSPGDNLTFSVGTVTLTDS